MEEEKQSDRLSRQEAPSLSQIVLQRSERGLLTGETRTGKSTLANLMLDRWAESDKSGRILVIDTKPRFRAQFDMTGLPAAWRYRDWRQGADIPWSYRLSVGASGASLRQAWGIARSGTPKNRGVILIAQVPINEHHVSSYFPWLDYLIRSHFAHISKRWWNYFYVDEMLAFMRESRRMQGGVVQVVTAGGELGHTFLGGTQRPAWIPKEVMTEMTRLYAFQMSGDEDVDKIRKMGLPRGFRVPSERHVFHHYNKLTKYDAFMSLSSELAQKYG